MIDRTTIPVGKRMLTDHRTGEQRLVDCPTWTTIAEVVSGITLKEALIHLGADHHIRFKHRSRCLTRQCVGLGVWKDGELSVWRTMSTIERPS